jgi:hypothetical protein
MGRGTELYEASPEKFEKKADVAFGGTTGLKTGFQRRRRRNPANT